MEVDKVAHSSEHSSIVVVERAADLMWIYVEYLERVVLASSNKVSFDISCPLREITTPYSGVA
jgi:hypothetical protein